VIASAGLKIINKDQLSMEADQIKKLYQAMAENGFSSLELELAEKNRVRLVLDAVHEEFPGDNVAAQLAALDETESPANTQVEIRSDKVGTFAFADRQLK
jgi:hypothetical protein